VPLDNEAPGYEVAGAEIRYCDINRQPILLLARDPANSEFRKYRDLKAGIPSMPETRHYTANCGCCALTAGNNLEGRLYLSICLPRRYMPAAETTELFMDRIDTLNLAGQRFLNPSMVFFGNLSELNTSIGKLCRRQPLAKLERDLPMPYHPFLAEVNLDEHKHILRAVLVCLSKKETIPFYASLQESYKTERSCLEDWPRFASFEEQQKVIDIKLAGYVNAVSLDSILSNSIHCAPFVGAHLCPWCANMLISYGIHDLVQHIIRDHKVLQESSFSCPSCLGTSFCTWKEWMPHWHRYHAAGAALVVVLNDIAVHTR